MQILADMRKYMEYRGLEYFVVPGIECSSWRWTVCSGTVRLDWGPEYVKEGAHKRAHLAIEQIRKMRSEGQPIVARKR